MTQHIRPCNSCTVAGIDVGGAKKGFHVVALTRVAYMGQISSKDPREIATWCCRAGVQVIGIDAPCRWTTSGTTRAAEFELKRAGIQCFSTPTMAAAQSHPLNHYGWMLNGAKLFEELEKTHPLFTGNPDQITNPICFETFPQAIACALAGEIVSAKQKRSVRRNLLTQAGIDITNLTNIDKVGAALCALAAHHMALGDFKTYGDTATGLIVVPGIKHKPANS